MPLSIGGFCRGLSTKKARHIGRFYTCNHGTLQFDTLAAGSLNRSLGNEICEKAGSKCEGSSGDFQWKASSLALGTQVALITPRAMIWRDLQLLTHLLDTGIVWQGKISNDS